MLNSRVEREVKTVARRLQIELRRGKDLIRVERDWYRISTTARYCSTARLLLLPLPGEIRMRRTLTSKPACLGKTTATTRPDAAVGNVDLKTCVPTPTAAPTPTPTLVSLLLRPRLLPLSLLLRLLLSHVICCCRHWQPVHI